MNIEHLTIGELAKVEEISGLAMDQMGDPNAPKAKLSIALAYVLRKRTDPKVKLADIESMGLTEIHELLREDSKSGD